MQSTVKPKLGDIVCVTGLEENIDNRFLVVGTTYNYVQILNLETKQTIQCPLNLCKVLLSSFQKFDRGLNPDQIDEILKRLGIDV